MYLEEAVLKLSDHDVRLCFEQDQHCLEKTEESGLLLHRMLLSMDPSDIICATGRRMVIYLLRNHGLDVNSQDHGGNTALHLCTERHGDSEICEALLQCGADMYLTNKLGVSAMNYAMTHPDVPETTRELFTKYRPGLWQAIEGDDLMNVRKLINLWCRVDLIKNGQTLKQAALDRGTEDIIRLVIDIAPSMTIAHSVMAGDVRAVEEMCNSEVKVNYNFRNLGDMGATPLFYAIMQNSHKMVQLLHNRGAKIDVTITFEDQDIPLYFITLHNTVDPDIITSLTPSVKEMPSFADMHYKGLNAVQFAVKNSLSAHVISYIIQQGFPELLCRRDQSNHSPREAAEMMGNTTCVSVIDEIVHKWYLDNSDEYRKVLALYGYPYMREAQKDGVYAYEIIQSMETSSEQARFHSQLTTYQDQICRLHEAVEEGDFSTVNTLLHYTSDYPQCFHSCLANSFTKNDSQPLLHKAVLRRHVKIVELICQTLVNVVRVKVQNVCDAWHRTALHYAYGIPEAKDVIYLLQDFGCSDFVMDRDGRSPLVFYDHRHHPEMSKLILYHIKRDYLKAEPNPWTVRRTDQFRERQDEHHCKSSHCQSDLLHYRNDSNEICGSRIPMEALSFHRGFLMRLLRMGSEQRLMYRQKDVGEDLHEDVIEEQEEMFGEMSEEERQKRHLSEIGGHSPSCVML